MSAVGEQSGKVWRNSYPVNDPRAQVARRFGDGSVYQGKIAARCIAEAAGEWAAMMRAKCQPQEDCQYCQARKDHKPCRQHGYAWLHRGVINTLRLFLSQCPDWATGKIEVTLERIAEVAQCSRITVIRHLKALRKAGWIDWVRRIKRNGDSGPWVTTANAYFFEKSRLPKRARMHLAQKLKRAGLSLSGNPDRKGSGAVPSFRERMIAKLGRGAKKTSAEKDRKAHKARVAEGNWMRAEWEFFGDTPTEQWAALRHPGDIEAQRDYARRLGIDTGS